MALKVVYPICCGIDVHKDFLVACITRSVGEYETESKLRRFSTFTHDIERLRDWLIEHSCYDVCMESTGKYWFPVNQVLEKEINVVIANPKYLKAIRGRKTDKNDAKWISNLFRLGVVVKSFNPPKAIRELRETIRYMRKLTNMKSSEKNRAQNTLTAANFKIDKVFSDIFGVSGTRIIDNLIEQPDGNFEIKPLISNRCKAKIEDIKEALVGNFTPTGIKKLNLIRANMQSLDGYIGELSNIINEQVKPFEKTIDLLITVPGISRNSAINIISEIGNDMSVFPTSKHLCSWAGLVPQNNESAGKKKTTRISKAGLYLKPVLVQCALAACRSKDHPEITNRYKALKYRRGHKKAIIAICRMMLTAIYNMIKKGENYNSALYKKEEFVPKSNNKLALEDALKIIAKAGYFVVDEVGEIKTS